MSDPSDAVTPPAGGPNLVDRSVRWAVRAAVFGALIYLGGSIWAGFDDMKSAFAQFQWWLVPPLIALTLSNYLLRFLKWHYYLGLLKVPMKWAEDLWNYLAGLAMVISPAKAGELLKPYVVRARTGVPMATTIPALVSERLTDAIAMLALAGISVTTYAADQVHYVIAPLLLVGVGLAVLAHPISLPLLAGWTCVLLIASPHHMPARAAASPRGSCSRRHPSTGRTTPTCGSAPAPAPRPWARGCARRCSPRRRSALCAQFCPSGANSGAVERRQLQDGR